MGQEGSGYDCDLMARSTIRLGERGPLEPSGADRSPRLWLAIQQPGGQVHGRTEGSRRRCGWGALLDKMALFVVDKKSSYRGECGRLSIGIGQEERARGVRSRWWR